MVSYASEMEDFHKILNALIEYPGTDFNIEIDGQVMINDLKRRQLKCVALSLRGVSC